MIAAVWILLLGLGTNQPVAQPETLTQTASTLPSAAPPLTVAEKSDYTATSKHAEVLAFIDELVRISPVARRGTLGKSVEGRELPLIILANPPIETAEQAAASGKLVAFAFGNIHAGEVCGKEALLMLAREIGTQQNHPLLKHLVIVFSPNFNADGNERFSKDNRPGQVGPAEGMGVRHNAQGLDLNRDWVKLESPENQSLVAFLNAWDPALIIDTHTTNGSHHQYTITYAGPRNPAGDERVISFVRDELFPTVTRRMLKKTGYKSFFYGNFRDEHTRWQTYPGPARYGTPYRGLRNQLAILSEAYAYASYRDRVLATREFVRLCLEYVAEQRVEIASLLRKVDEDAIARGQKPSFEADICIQQKLSPSKDRVRVEGFIEKDEDGKRVATTPHTYEVELWADCVAEKTVRLPYAYVMPSPPEGVIEKLRQHGITVEQLTEACSCEVESYRVVAIEKASRIFQGHHMTTLSVTTRREKRTLAAGATVIRTGQKLGVLAVYLLEPESEDGLAAWNFFDNSIAAGEDFPILRVPKSQVSQTLLYRSLRKQP